MAPSPDGRNVAVVAIDAAGGWSLLLIDTVNEGMVTLVEPGDIRVSWARWAPDGQSLLVVRSDLLPDGSQGVGRAWLMRVTGEFVGPVDPEGEPTIGARWSTNGDRIAYVAPATGRLVALHANSGERVELGTPRSTEFDWSPAGDRIAFESVPAGGDSGPFTQPVRIRSLDLATDIYIGMPGEIMSQPRWTAPDTLAVVRRETGAAGEGPQLWFLSIPLGEKLRAIQLAGAAEAVPSWDLSPDGQRIVFVAATALGSAVYTLNLDTNERALLPVEGRLPRWLP